MTRQDGLSNNVVSIFQDRAGHFWFTTSNGLTRFRPPAAMPAPAVINAVVADRRYQDISELEISSTVELVAFEFSGANFKTRPDAMVYRYRLKGYEEGWRNTHKRRVEYEDLPRGIYTFEVVAVDRDLVYSETPATLALTVHLPYERIGLLSALGIAIVLIGWQAVRIVQRDQRLQKTNAALSSANNELFQTNKNLEMANEQIQEQTQRKSAFLASMSHELRTPMNAIKGFTNLVLRRRSENLTERQRGNLEKVTQASDHLLAMINDLLDLAKIEAGQMDVNASTFDVGELVDYCVSTVSPLVQEGVVLSAEIDEGIGEAHTDEVRLRQMLINLTSNAIKFTDSGRVTVKARKADKYLELSVSDTGKGIPEDELATIFDEYRQVEGSDREHKGTGLGLSITKQFAELLGGSIGVESEVGKGSTFTVRVPVMYKEG